jgi:hypothetical protein
MIQGIGTLEKLYRSNVDRIGFWAAADGLIRMCVTSAGCNKTVSIRSSLRLRRPLFALAVETVF